MSDLPPLDEFIEYADKIHPDFGPMFGRDAARVARELKRLQAVVGHRISLDALNALDASLDLTVDVLLDQCETTADDRAELAAELCKARGMVLEARDPGKGVTR